MNTSTRESACVEHFPVSAGLCRSRKTTGDQTSPFCAWLLLPMNTDDAMEYWTASQLKPWHLERQKSTTKLKMLWRTRSRAPRCYMCMRCSWGVSMTMYAWMTGVSWLALCNPLKMTHESQRFYTYITDIYWYLFFSLLNFLFRSETNIYQQFVCDANVRCNRAATAQSTFKKDAFMKTQMYQNTFIQYGQPVPVGVNNMTTHANRLRCKKLQSQQKGPTAGTGALVRVRGYQTGQLSLSLETHLMGNLYWLIVMCSHDSLQYYCRSAS